MSPMEGNPAGGSFDPRRVPSGQRWEVLHRPPPMDKLRRIEMKIDPWWGRSGRSSWGKLGRGGKNARHRVFSDGTHIYLALETWKTSGVDGKYSHRYEEWYRLLPPQE